MSVFVTDFALCGSYKLITCRVADAQIDFTANLFFTGTSYQYTKAEAH